MVISETVMGDLCLMATGVANWRGHRSTLGTRGTTMHCADVFTALCIVRRQQLYLAKFRIHSIHFKHNVNFFILFMSDKYMEIQINLTFAGTYGAIVLCGDVVM